MQHWIFLQLAALLLGLNQPTAEGWPRHTIDASSSGADGVKLADINADGRLDITTGWEEGGLTKLYLHPGKEQVKAEWPSVIVGRTPKVEDAVFADLDGDDLPEIISCTENKAEKIWIHRASGDDLLNPQTWSQASLPAADGRMMWMYAEPLQVDGKNGIDLIAAGKNEGAALGWFEAPEDPRDLDAWKWHSITPVGWIMSILLRDIDEDGDTDIVITDRRGPLRGCRWLENPGVGARQHKQWKSHEIGPQGLEVMFMTMADLDGDGVEEAVVSERTGQTVRIYKQTDRDGVIWQETVIQLPLSKATAKSVEVGDMNGDGTPDLVISTNTNGEILAGLYWLDGQKIRTAQAGDFQSISGAHNAKYDKVELIDIDEDGDKDVLICEENYGPESQGLGLIWYENTVQ